MITLYGSPGTASFSVHWALLELQLDFQIQWLNFEQAEQKSPEYLKLNPNGHVPTLVVDRLVITEAAAILFWLADQHPASALRAPTDAAGRARYYQWMMYLVNTVQPAYRNWFYPHQAITPAQDDLIKDNAKLRIEGAFDQINRHLTQHRYFAGETCTVVDLHATMLMRWSRHMPKPATHWPAIAAYVDHMRQREAFKTLNEREGLTEWL
jgi:glutathione S-transferase